MNRHEMIDQRSLAMGRAIAEKLRNDPTLLEHAKANVRRWLLTCSPRSESTLIEWKQTLDGPIEGVFELLTGENQRAIRLRQSSPFAGVLPEAERLAILYQYEAYFNERRRAEARDQQR